MPSAGLVILPSFISAFTYSNVVVKLYAVEHRQHAIITEDVQKLDQFSDIVTTLCLPHI